jgi:hypothetical protein
VLPGHVPAIRRGKHMDQRVFGKLDLFGTSIGQQAWRTYGHVALVKDERAFEMIPLAIAKANGAIELAHFHQVVPGLAGQADFQFGMGCTQAPKARQ